MTGRSGSSAMTERSRDGHQDQHRVDRADPVPRPRALSVFGDQAVSAAMIVRILHHAEVLTLNSQLPTARPRHRQRARHQTHHTTVASFQPPHRPQIRPSSTTADRDPSPANPGVVARWDRPRTPTCSRLLPDMSGCRNERCVQNATRDAACVVKELPTRSTLSNADDVVRITGVRRS